MSFLADLKHLQEKLSQDQIVVNIRLCFKRIKSFTKLTKASSHSPIFEINGSCVAKSLCHFEASNLKFPTPETTCTFVMVNVSNLFCKIKHPYYSNTCF